MSEPTNQKDAGWASRTIVPPVAALQFLTLCPPLIRRLFTPAEMGRAVGCFPLIGALLGGVLAALDWGFMRVFPPEVSTVLVIAAATAMTGALHLDGFFDACDGLLGGHTPESRLEIMHDERVGAFGLAGGVLLLMLKFWTLFATPRRIVALILAATLSRWAIAMALVYAPYAREVGLGRAMKDHAGIVQAALATGTALLVAFLATGWQGLLLVLLIGATTWLVTRYALNRIPGLTGDLYGAISELSEVIVLLAFAAGL
jgi:adenosylcobinamide-GDP ribazoletransferase